MAKNLKAESVRHYGSKRDADAWSAWKKSNEDKPAAQKTNGVSQEGEENSESRGDANMVDARATHGEGANCL